MRIDFTPSDGKRIAAEYTEGCAYVDLFFGGHRLPSEVINVWDHATGTPDERAQDPWGLTEILAEWVADNDAEWPEWYAGYMANLP